MPELLPNDEKAPVRFVPPSKLKDKMIVRSIKGKEKMGGLFAFNLELISDKDNLAFDDVVGQKVTAVLVLDEFNNKERFFNGYITEFKYLGFDGKYHKYHAKVRPWLWLLTRTSDCQIFQNKTVPTIIKEVFKLNHMVDYEAHLGDKYRVWEYCVQYNESDFDFISRLMQQEGIYYYFKHEKDKHIMVLTDGSRAHEKYPDFEKIHFDEGFYLNSSHNSLDTWSAKQSMMPNKYAIQDYDFENPKVDLLSKYTKTMGHVWPIEDPEIFDYPGEYVKRDDGSTYAEIRLQELQCQQERMRASGGTRGLSPGYIFELTDYPRADQNKEYLTISIEHEINNHDFISGELEGKSIYRCHVEVMDKLKQPFRSPRKTPQPIVRGPQTAIVVGPESDEIFTDKYGRVKVQFHWDRYGKKDANSSCWVRVSQAWAGKNWGAMHIPRIGQEVIVSFLEGDPDRPIITGRVYNAVNMPPYDLDTNKTQSGIKSRSSLDGGPDNFNEIRFEDKKDEEELYIHAEKNHTNITENDRTENVGHDRSTTVKNDYSLKVGNDALVNIGYEGDSGCYTMNVCNDRIESVSNGDYKIGVDTGSRELYIKTNDKVEVQGSRLEVIQNTLDSQCKDLKLAGSATMLAKSPDVKIKGTVTTYIGDNQIKVNGTVIDIEGQLINIKGNAGVNISCGGTSVKLNPGAIIISGPMVNINT